MKQFSIPGKQAIFYEQPFESIIYCSQSRILIIFFSAFILFSGVAVPTYGQNPWAVYIPEYSAGAVQIAQTKQSRVQTTIGGTGDSYGIGSDKRGYVYVSRNSSGGGHKIDVINSATRTVVGSIKDVNNISSPHGFTTIYDAPSNKWYLCISNVGYTVNTGAAIAIIDVTVPTAPVLYKSISLAGVSSTVPGKGVTGLVSNAAGTELYGVVDDGTLNSQSPDSATGNFYWFKISNPLNANPTINIFSTLLSGTGSLSTDTKIIKPHTITVDNTNGIVYIANSQSKNATQTGYVASYFTATGAPTMRMYQTALGSKVSTRLHGLNVSKDGARLYVGSVDYIDANTNPAYVYSFVTDASASGSLVTMSPSYASANLNVNNNAGVYSVFLSPDGQQLFAYTDYGKTFKLSTADVTTISTLKLADGLTDYIPTGIIDKHSDAFTLIDDGDAPATYGHAPHSLNNDEFLNGTLHLGATVDGDTSYAPSAAANGDDLAQTPAMNDEDGLSVIPVIDATTANYTLSVSVLNNTGKTATLVGFVDFNRNGVFTDAGENVTASVPSSALQQTITISFPLSAGLFTTSGTTYTRLRLSTDPSLSGTANINANVFDGEAEDYVTTIAPWVSGVVYDDANGLNDNTVNGVVSNAGGALNAVLFDNSTGKVAAVSSIALNGTYSFSITQGDNYSVEITTNTAIVGSTVLPVAALPANWVNTGENIGSGAGNDGTVDGILNLGVLYTNVSNADFGIEIIPISPDQSYTIPTPAVGTSFSLNGTGASNSPAALSGNDAEDGVLGASESFTIISLAGMYGNKLFYNGTQITAPYTIANYNPTLLQVQFTGMSSTTLNFNYSSTDAAGKSSASAIYTINWLFLLPMNITSFTATSQENDVKLNWQTSSEISINYFVIEYSTDGINYIDIGELTVQNNSEPANYSWVHLTPSAGVNYYRLKMVGSDGNYTYSDVKKVNRLVDNKEMIVYPNPVRSAINLILPQVTGDNTQVHLFNAEGRLMKIISANHQQKITVDVEGLAAGFYSIIVINNGHARYAAKLMKL